MIGETAAIPPKTADLIVFAGQSNMAGRGIASPRRPERAPRVPERYGLEYRAVSEPDRLFPLTEPFGVKENDPEGIDDGTRKTGSLVSAFVNACWEQTETAVIAVSASKGGSSLSEWQPGTKYMSDLLRRYRSAENFLQKEGVSIRRRCLVWCQGETDGDRGTGEAVFKAQFRGLLHCLLAAGIEQIFLISIGSCNIPGAEDRYDNIIKWEHELAESEAGVTCVSDAFVTMRERGLMKDEFHYYQQGYNECGTEAGRNAGKILNKRPERLR